MSCWLAAMDGLLLHDDGRDEKEKENRRWGLPPGAGTDPPGGSAARMKGGGWI